MTKEDILAYLKEHKEEFAKKYGVKDIALFGSYARDEANEDSDIDIVIEFKKADLFNQIAIMQDLRAFFNKKVDVISIWKHMNPKLKKRIDKEAIYV